MRVGRALPSVMTMSHPQSYEILLVPAFTDGRGTTAETPDEKPATEEKPAGESAAGTEPAAGQVSAVGPDAVSDSDVAVGTKTTASEQSRPTDAGAAGPEAPPGAAAERYGSGTQGAAPEDSGSRAAGALRPGTAIRSAIVAATGETGESGYPRYAGDGMVADIDPVTRTVEALLIDGSELDYGLSVRVSERNVNG